MVRLHETPGAQQHLGDRFTCTVIQQYGGLFPGQSAGDEHTRGIRVQQEIDRSLGLIVGIYALTFIASMAGDEHNNKEVAVLATILAVGSYLAFIVLLKLQFPVWPSFLTR